MKTTRYETRCFSDCGKIRLQNEDSYLLRQQESGQGLILLAAVADGMGGLEKGKQASQMLIQALEEWWKHELPELLAAMADINAVKTSLEMYISCANQRILQQNEKMGTTLSLLLIWGQRYLVQHAGDSRVYFLRKIGLERVTNDQTWYEQARQYGTLPQCQHSMEKMKSVLVNAIGVKFDYHLETAQGELDNVEMIRLCSDGVYKYLSDTRLETILKSRKTVIRKSQQIETLLQTSEAKDNYTAVLIQTKKSRCRLARLRNIF